MTVELRDARVDEAAEIADLLNEHGQAAFGETEIAEAEVRHWFTLPEIRVQVAERDGRLVGYADSVLRGKEGRTEVDVRTLDRDAAEALLHAAVDAASSPSARAVVQGEDAILRQVVEEDGWRPVRSSYQMRIELGDDVPEPDWPAGISVRVFEPRDEQRLHEANELAFAEDWDFRPQTFEQWRNDAFGRDNADHSLSWLAEDGDELAGYSLNAWHSSEDPEFGWVASLGVLPEYRRRGLGAALLQQSFREFRRRGATRVGLGVDSENVTGAVRLYERVGMHVHRLNVTYEKALS
jgi:mycothiol synthase